MSYKFYTSILFEIFSIRCKITGEDGGKTADTVIFSCTCDMNDTRLIWNIITTKLIGYNY